MSTIASAASGAVECADQPSTSSAAALAASYAANSNGATSVKRQFCRYFVQGICRYGPMCRFSHNVNDLMGLDFPATGAVDNTSTTDSSETTTTTSTPSDLEFPKPSTSRHSWVNAPIFVPKRTNVISANFGNDITSAEYGIEVEKAPTADNTSKTWAGVVAGVVAGAVPQVNLVDYHEPGSLNMLCPSEGPCPYGAYCVFGIHLELCDMCDQYCLIPGDQVQRRKHNQECLQQHEQAMELSFAIARSKDKTCGICFDVIMEKAGREKRFGILPNCSHIFCLECIRKWRQAKQFEHKITRSCPECRVCSDYVCPSAFWVETKEDKDKLLNDYRAALGAKDCKYFKKGDGKCPFGNKCFYKHALPNGEIVDVGCPKRVRKIHRSTNEIINLLDIYLWEYVDERDYHWLDLISSSSDDSESDLSEFDEP